MRGIELPVGIQAVGEFAGVPAEVANQIAVTTRHGDFAAATFLGGV